MLIAYAVIFVLFVIAICAINRRHAAFERRLQENRGEFDRQSSEFNAWLADYYADPEDD